MYDFTESVLRLLKPLFANRLRAKANNTGTSLILDGNSAIAATEAAISQAAGLAAPRPGDFAAMAWHSEQQHRYHNVNAEHRLETVSAEGHRGALAAAAGMSVAGMRATAFLSGQDSGSVQDLLTMISERHLPLVVHIDNSAIGGASGTAGSGHESLHLNADSSCFLLCASNVQEAVDFTVIARRVAEQTLLPCLVSIDREQTATSPQQVWLPPSKWLEDFLGRPEELVSCQSPAEKLLFGDERRRIPRWHNPDRPVLLGAEHATNIRGLGRVASRLYLEQDLGETLTQTVNLFAGYSGRQHAQITIHPASNAGLLLVAMGSAVETAEAVADQLRSTQKLQVGVLGIRSLRPFPAEQITEQLRRSQTVCVMERSASPATIDPPLMRKLKAALHRTGKNNAGNAVEPPRLLSVLYGLGGLPLHAADLVKLCLRVDKIQRNQVYLGISFDQTRDPYPKCQVLLDKLHRSYPHIADMGLVSKRTEPPDLSPEDALTLSFHRVSGCGGDGLAQETAKFLWQLAGGELRSRITQSPLPWGDTCTDWISWAPAGMRDPGDQPPVDLAIISDPASVSNLPALQLKQRAALIIASTTPDSIGLPQEIVERIQGCEAQLYRIDSGVAQADSGLDTWRLLGATMAILLQRDLLETSFRRLLSCLELLSSDLSRDLIEARLSAFKSGFDQLTAVDTDLLQALPKKPVSSASEVSPQLHRLGKSDEYYDSLPLFWGQTGVLYREGHPHRILPDPYLAIGAIPPLSTAFNRFDNLRTVQPVLDAEACTGCGACWSLCPDSAIGVSTIDPTGLLEAGMRITGMDSLRPLIARLSKWILNRCSEKGAAPVTAAELLNGAFDWLLQQSLPENRKQLVSEAKTKFVGAIGELQVCVTDALFKQPESKASGSGNILLLTINPSTCKGCGICVTNCEPNALYPEKQTTELSAQAERNWRVWETLPETKETAIASVDGKSLPAKPAAMLMLQGNQRMMRGGDGAEPGSGERLALRLALAAVESIQRPLIKAFTGEVDAIREQLARLIRKMLADALPADDLDTLAAGLESVNSSETNLTNFINEKEGAIATRIDALRMRRLISLAQKLRNLSWQLTEGRQGFGRASLGLVLSSDAPSGWAGVFPDNPFAVPVTVDTSGDAPQFAAGLQQGQVQQALEGFVLMRKARLELENPADAARLWSSLDNIGWEDLQAEERALCPPVLVVASSAAIAGRSLSQLTRLMAGQLPVKLLLFPELDMGVANAGNDTVPMAPVEDPAVDLALLTLSRRHTLNAQCSIGFPEHLMTTLKAALDYSGPALIQVYAPSPGRHGFAADQTVQQARLAVETRTFPLFVYDPRAEGVFGSRFNLQDNPDPGSDWSTDAADITLTTAIWAKGQKRFSQCFSPLQTDTEDIIPLEEYIGLPQEMRNGKKPFITHGDTTRYHVQAPLARACEERLRCWRTLQEIAGVVTPFTQQIEQQAEQNVAESHQAELQKMQADYENRIACLKQEMLEQSRREIRIRLMAMAGYDESSLQEKTIAPQ